MSVAQEQIQRRGFGVAITEPANQQVVFGNFDPAQDFVDLAGTFNGWGTDPLTVLADADGDTIYMSARNIQGVRVLRANELNAYTILWADNLVFTQASLQAAEEVFA